MSKLAVICAGYLIREQIARAGEPTHVHMVTNTEREREREREAPAASHICIYIPQSTPTNTLSRTRRSQLGVWLIQLHGQLSWERIFFQDVTRFAGGAQAVQVRAGEPAEVERRVRPDRWIDMQPARRRARRPCSR
jgi:hypothetical protein